MNRPTPYEHPRRKSHVQTAPKGKSAPPLTLVPLAGKLVSGAIGTLPLTVGVYQQLKIVDQCDPLAEVRINGREEIIGTTSTGRLVRAELSVEGLPQLILRVDSK